MRIVTVHRTFFWPAAEEFRSQHKDNQVWVSVHDQTTGDNVYIKMSIFTDDVNGFAKKLYISLADKEKTLAEICKLADNLPNPLTMDWMKEQGFEFD